MTTPAFRRKIISDHAVVRYMERKYGADFDIVRQEMYCPDLQTAIAQGARSFTRDGVKFILYDKKVVTVVPGGDNGTTKD